MPENYNYNLYDYQNLVDEEFVSGSTRCKSNVATQDSSTIRFTGDGSVCNPLSANVIISGGTDDYLPLSGGTVSGDVTVEGFTVKDLATGLTPPVTTGITKHLVSDSIGNVSFTEDYSYAMLSIFQRNMQNFL